MMRVVASLLDSDAFGPTRAYGRLEPLNIERRNPDTGYKERVQHWGILAPGGSWAIKKRRGRFTRRHYTVRTYGIDL